MVQSRGRSWGTKFGYSFTERTTKFLRQFQDESNENSRVAIERDAWREEEGEAGFSPRVKEIIGDTGLDPHFAALTK